MRSAAESESVEHLQRTGVRSPPVGAQSEERQCDVVENAPPGDAVRQRDAFAQAFPDLRGKRLLLSLGRIVRQKGCDVSIRAFANVARHDPDLRLVFAGPDQIGWQAALEREARELGIADRVIWTGNLTGDLKWGAFRASEAFSTASPAQSRAKAFTGSDPS